jgi:WD40-like Beta Propeller Repeat
VEGSAVAPLADFSKSSGGSWGVDGNIIVGTSLGLVLVPASGGAPSTVLEKAPEESDYLFPQILPGGKAVLFESRTQPQGRNTDSIELFSFADRRRKTLVRGGASSEYLPSGHLIYNNQRTLFAIPFDVNRLETRGTAVPVLDDLAVAPAGGVDLAFAANGGLLYRRGSAAAGPGMTIQWLDGAGKKEPLLAKPGAYQYLNLSPDGKRVAITLVEGGIADIWVYDPQRDTMTRLTFGGARDPYPLWSPDGQYVVFPSGGNGIGDGIFYARADGAGQPQPLTQSKNVQFPGSFTPNGMRLAYDDNESGKSQIWTVPQENQGGQLKAGKPEQFLKSGFIDHAWGFSPDGHWLAYTSNESGKFEVYVRAFPPPSSGQGGKWQISNSGGTKALWARNGHELVYRSGDQLMAVNYSVNGDSFVAEKPRVWIDKLGGTNWDLAPDGKRVAVITPVAAAGEAPKPDHEVTILFNFFDELRRRVPAK